MLVKGQVKMLVKIQQGPDMPPSRQQTVSISKPPGCWRNMWTDPLLNKTLIII